MSKAQLILLLTIAEAVKYQLEVTGFKGAIPDRIKVKMEAVYAELEKS